MRPHWHGLTLGFLLPSLAFVADQAASAPSPLDAGGLSSREPASLAYLSGSSLRTRDEHGHGSHHAQPIVELNETEITLYHAPTPDSYWTIDIAERDPDVGRYPGLMLVHVLFMCAAFFGALPAGIALRSVNHPWHGFTTILFWTFTVLGCAASGLYKKLTPDMYEGQKHSSQSYIVLFLALIVTAIDLFAGFGRIVSYVQSIRGGQRFSLKTFWRNVVLAQEERPAGSSAEYTNLVAEEPEEMEMDLKPQATHEPVDDDDETAQWANDVHRHAHHPSIADTERTVFDLQSPRGSQHSDETLHEHTHGRHSLPNAPLIRKIGRIAFATLERSLVFAGFGQLLMGIVIYTGGCRENYINGCLAHLIKGGIFWCYGLATFGRFLGAFAEYGWAWNRTPVGDYVSAEMVESFVIFFYGITNTWMERFGAHPGDPYTTKQVQHISIAVMFWFAGLVGMGLESRIFRRWLAGASTAALKAGSKMGEAVAEPPSYSGSFNPFPALVIGVTGVAMSAHFQTYLFQVQIHALWGNLLAAFAVLRCLTYFFLWLGPPRSILPSRPPTEALGSFFLACGGLVFMFSDEEVTIAAMRQGHDDVMMFANVAVAITCFAFVWALCVVGFKGWLKSRTHSAVSFHSSA